MSSIIRLFYFDFDPRRIGIYLNFLILRILIGETTLNLATLELKATFPDFS